MRYFITRKFRRMINISAFEQLSIDNCSFFYGENTFTFANYLVFYGKNHIIRKIIFKKCKNIFTLSELAELEFRLWLDILNIFDIV